MKTHKTKVISNFDAWDNIAYTLEGLGSNVQQCIKEGMDRKEVYQAVEKYLSNVLVNYDSQI